MKTVLSIVSALALSMLASPSYAEENELDMTVVMSCTVPVENAEPIVSLSVLVQSDSASDFVIVQVTENSETFLLFSQLEQGEVAQQMADGGLTSLLLQEDFSSDSGVIRNAGVISVAFEAGAEAGTGLMAARGHLYPLSCTKN